MNRLGMRAGSALKKLGQLTGALVLAGGALVGAAQAAQYTPTAAITLPGNVAQSSFDIGYVDTTLGTYFLASRNLAGILAVNTTTKAATVIGQGDFAGVKTSATSGPNGVITVNHNQVWAGDGTGAIRIYNATTGALVTTIGPVLTATVTATDRADEACWDPSHNVVLWAWDEPADNFVAFISTTNYQVLKVIKMDGTNGAPNATAGIEQCQWDARTNLIYQNLPEVNGPGNDTAPGQTIVYNGANQSIVNTFTIPVANCNGPAGMVIGPRTEIALSCGLTGSGATAKGNGSVAINENTGAVVATFPSVWGCDEMTYDAGAAHYAWACSNFGAAASPPTGELPFAATATDTVDQTITTAPSEHSVAADYVHRQIYFPVVSSGTNASAAAQKLCSSVGGTDSLGCVLVLTRQ